MLRNLSRIATNVCRQQRFTFEAIRALASTPLKMPSLSPTMSEGTIIRWLKKEGEEINPGDALCEIQTDKATMTLDTEDEGILAKILMPDNSTDVKVGKLIALIVEKGDDWKNVEVPKTEASQKPSETKQPLTKEKEEQPKTDKQQQSEQSHHAIGPAARTLLEQYGIEPSKIQGTGPHGVVMKSDVQKYIESNQLKVKSRTEETKPTKQPTSDKPQKQISESGGRRYHDIEISSIRRAIAKRLTFSKTNIPHQYISITSNVDQIIKLRKQMISDPKATVKVSVNDFIIKAVANALRQVPQMNGIYEDNKGLKLQSTVDISVAVATDNGLITPIVFNADRLSVQDINGQVRQLATKAKDGKLKPNEFQGGSFTISNLGMFGIRSFSAVINPPQIGILAIGQNFVRHTGDDLKAENQLVVTLSYDARACDPQSSALFLQAFRSYMENPNMLISNNKSESILNF
jgi:pyruvate dehydrogenase complex dihydrolipoamide acetyltransferase long form